MLVSEFDILFEGAADYKVMFLPLMNLLADCPERYKTMVERVQNNAIMFTRSVLKRSDRGIWFLRYARRRAIESCFAAASTRDDLPLDVAEKLDVLDGQWKRTANGAFFTKSASTNDDVLLYGMRALEDRLRHFMGIDCAKIQNYKFGNQSPLLIMQTFELFEEEWKKSRKGEMKDDGAELLIRFPDGMAWYDSKKPKCPAEGDAMGHCGNQYDWREGDTILSLRRKMGSGRIRPSLTFILDVDGYLGETKGRENAKPNAKYHNHIVALLKTPIVKGIKGGGYQPENNFSLTDLSEEERKTLFALRPELMPPLDYFRVHGCDEAFRAKVMKIVRNIEENDGPSDHHGKSQFIERDGQWIYAFEQNESWVDAIAVAGDESVRDAVAHHSDWNYHNSKPEQDEVEPWLFKEMPMELRGRIIDLAVERIKSNKHSMLEAFDFFETENLDDIKPEEWFDFICAKEIPHQTYDSLASAYEVGEANGGYNEVVELLRPLCKMGKITIDDFDGGYTWCTAEQVAIWSSVFKDSPILDDEMPIINNMPRFPHAIDEVQGWDAKAFADKLRRDWDK